MRVGQRSLVVRSDVEATVQLVSGICCAWLLRSEFADCTGSNRRVWSRRAPNHELSVLSSRAKSDRPHPADHTSRAGA